MKIRIELTDGKEEDEVVIRCHEIDSSIQKIQQYILEQTTSASQLAFFKDGDEYYFPLEEVLFFETDKDRVFAHTGTDAYQIRYRLYELEKMLPHTFVRISKSAIINTKHIYSIQRNLTAASLIRFHRSHKQIYVSRSYYKSLKEKLEERR